MVPAAILGCALPLLVLLTDALSGRLGANPIQRSEQQTGVLALSLLLLSLAATPLRLLASRVNLRLLWPARVRKTLGVWAFVYAALHLLIYGLDKGFGPLSFLRDAATRPYITAGLAAFLLLIPLVWTSRRDSVKQLGFQRWQRLHRLAYVAAGLGVLHFWWSVKRDLSGPILALVAFAVLMALRLLQQKRRERGGKA